MAETSVDMSEKKPGWSVAMVDNSALAEIPAHILLVDDDPSILIAMASLLEGPGRTVLTANTGQSALRYLLRHDCAVIVLDVRMPQMDGFELAGLIRQRDRSRFTPIIFLSGVDTMDADVVRGLSSGAVDYLVKPVAPDILRRKVDVFVELFQLREWANKQARKQSEERFRLLVEGIEDYAIVLLDLDGKVATWNKGVERLTGYVSEEILGQPYACLYPPEEVTLPDDDLKQAIEVVTGKAVGAEVDRQLVMKDGSRFIANVMVTALRDERKALQAYAVVIRDVTERKHAEQATARLAAIVESSSDAIIGKDTQGTITSWNRGAEALLGYTATEAIGQPMTLLFPPELMDEEPTILDRLRKGESIRQYETVRRCKDRREIAVSLTISPIQDKQGRVLGASEVLRDISERKQAEEALREAQGQLQRWNVELEQAVNVKTAELTQSQERLRTLTTELNLAEQRERKRLATELHDHLQQLLVLGKLKLGAGKRLTAGLPAVEKIMKETDDVFSDALTYTRTLVAELSPTALRDHGLAAGLKWLAEYMKKHEQTVIVNVPDGVGLQLPEDQVMLLFQSVRELLINSSKHAGTGEATVSMEQHDGNLSITVSDTGNGFDLAAAAGAAATPNGGISSKFGLFSVQERMRVLGGSFTIQSALGQGTTATLTLPLGGGAAVRTEVSGLRTELSGTLNHQLSEAGSFLDRSNLSPRHSVPSPQPSALSSIRVLLVDDHAMVRQGLRAVLDAYADLHVVGEAQDGAEAVKLAEELGPQVVVMDINMPRMNGIEATTQIKARWPEMRVIGISVNTGDGNSDAMKRAGAAIVLPKDTAVDQLHDAIIQEVGVSANQAASHHCPLRILIR